MNSVILISTRRHHDRVGRLQDLRQRADRLGALHLGDEQRVSARRAQQLARHGHVRTALGEGNGEEVHLQTSRGPDVFHVLGSQRRCGQASALPVDALVVGQSSAVPNRGDDLRRPHVDDVEHDAAVIQQQHVAGLHVVHQVAIVQADALLGAEAAVGVQHEALALGELNPVLLELSDADLRPLQVGHDADGAAQLARHVPHQRRAPRVILRGAMREVQPHDVHARGDHACKHLSLGTGGPQGGDDLGTALDGRELHGSALGARF